MDDEIDLLALDALAIRRLFAEELKRLTCNGLARKVADGSDTNPRTLAAINLALRLVGKPAEADRFVRDHSL